MEAVTDRILADETVNITRYRKNPMDYFKDKPLAVLKGNKTAGYVMSASAFEGIVAHLERLESASSVPSHFNPTAKRLNAIAEHGRELMGKITEDSVLAYSE